MICTSCPFRRDSHPGHLTNGPAEDPATLLSGFACGELLRMCDERDSRPCGGSLVFLRNTCKLPRQRSVARHVRGASADHAAVFSNIGEFCAHHQPGAEIMILGHRVAYTGLDPRLAMGARLVTDGEMQRMESEAVAAREAADRLQDRVNHLKARLSATERDSRRRAWSLREALGAARRKLQERSAISFGRFQTLEEDL